MLADNLKYLRKKHKLSQQQLADALELPRTTMGDYERGKTEPNIAMMVRMADYFDITLDALLNEQLSHEQLEVSSSDHLKILAISVDKDNEENIELVSTKAEAGYMENFSDPEYIRELPKLSIPNMPSGTYRGFEINGDSMLPLMPRSIVITSYVERLEDIKDDKTYVIIGNLQGVVYKRVRNQKDQKKLILISDNKAYLPYEVSYEEIDEVWQYYAHISFDDTQQLQSQLVDERWNDIQRKLTEIYDRTVTDA